MRTSAVAFLSLPSFVRCCEHRVPCQHPRFAPYRSVLALSHPVWACAWSLLGPPGNSLPGRVTFEGCMRGTDHPLHPQAEEVAQEAVEEPLVEPLLEPEGESYEESPQVRGKDGTAGMRAVLSAWWHRCGERSQEPASSPAPRAGSLEVRQVWLEELSQLSLLTALSFPISQEEYQEYEPEA